MRRAGLASIQNIAPFSMATMVWIVYPPLMALRQHNGFRRTVSPRSADITSMSGKSKFQTVRDSDLGILADSSSHVRLGLQRRVEHSALAHDLAARSKDLAIPDRLAAQSIGHVLDEQAAHPGM